MTMKARHRDLREWLPAPRVVVVDGDPGFRRDAGALLASHGFEVAGEAEDAAEAIALVAEVEPQVVLLGLQPPDVGRVEVAARLLARHRGLAVVLVSGRERSADVGPAFLDAVDGAAGFALGNERARQDGRLAEQRTRALLDAIPDTILRWGRDGTYLDIRADPYTAELFPREEFICRSVRDVLPDELARTILAGIERALDSGSMQVIEYEVAVGGVAHWREARIVPSGDGEVVAITRDFTEKRRADAELRRLAEEQAALRRVATLVASDAAPETVFQLVTEEVCRLLGIREAVLERFVDAETGTVVGRFGSHMTGGFEVGGTLPIEEGLVAWQVLHSGAPARVDGFDGRTGELAERIRGLGYRSAVGVPIVVAGSIWGTLVAALWEGESLPPETERRMQAFAELVGLAVASAQARDELAASRLRIVEAGDAERRRLERNLHDGAQQRLVALSLALRFAQGKVADSPDEARELLTVAVDELGEALVELRELAQGLHPAVLTARGLTPALEVLAARSPLPVALDVVLPERLPEPVEVAVYYVVSEGLANVVKHARAGSARVRVVRENGRVAVAVEDDGVGGAALDGGSGLYGLRDRVETLGGRLGVASAAGAGTILRAELPLRSNAVAGTGTRS
jgi:signal transduction histidine kinase/DNA-binding NarL/FixJ family response regulator